MQNYVINGVKVNFNLDSYLASSLNIQRKDMPQVNMDSFFKIIPMYQQYLNIDVQQIPASQLLPTQNEIDYSNVLVKAASRQLNDDQLIFICSNDFHIIDGHHRHVECLITNPDRLTTCYVFDLSIEELLDLIKKTSSILNPSVCIDGNAQSSDITVPVTEALVKMLTEDFGMQGPEAAPGMGDVKMPAVGQEAGDILDKSGHGSGDVPGTQKKKIDYKARIQAMYKRKGLDENGNLPKDLLEAIQEDVDRLGLVDTIVRIMNESMGDITREEWADMTARGLTRDSTAEQIANSAIIAPIVEDEEAYKMKNYKPESVSPEDWAKMNAAGTTGEATPSQQNDIDARKAGTYYDNSLLYIGEDGNLKLDKHFENAEGLDLKCCINKPVQRKCLQINEPFSCKTMEGITQGKAGDYLVQGIDGEIYPCDQEIFNNTYLITELEECKE